MVCGSRGWCVEVVGGVWKSSVVCKSRGCFVEVVGDKVPTQIVFSNSPCFPCFFPVQQHISPVPIHIIFDYFIHKTDLAD